VSSFVGINNLDNTINEAGQFVYTLPETISKDFDQFFKGIDADKAHFNIANYNFGNTTLEEVFINVGRKEEMGIALSQSVRLTSQQLKRISKFDDKLLVTSAS
jgi:hypothetical protein